MTGWTTDTALHVSFSHGGGGYSIEGFDGFDSATICLAAATDRPPADGIALVPCADPAGHFAVEGLIAVKLYVCQPGREDELVQFERDTQHRYYNFMAPVGWRYGGLCRVTSAMSELPQPFAELYSIDAQNQAEAEALDDKTKPEPPEILKMYEDCATFVVKGKGRWVWLSPRPR
jgi:hypothetical protein